MFMGILAIIRLENEQNTGFPARKPSIDTNNDLRRACTKISGADAAIDRMVAKIEAELASGRGGEVRSSRVGELALKELAAVDRLAYVRFATVYRRLSDVRELRAELEPMLAAPGGED